MDPRLWSPHPILFIPGYLAVLLGWYLDPQPHSLKLGNMPGANTKECWPQKVPGRVSELTSCSLIPPQKY